MLAAGGFGARPGPADLWGTRGPAGWAPGSASSPRVAGRAWRRASKRWLADWTFPVPDRGLAGAPRRVRPWHCQRAHNQRGSGTLCKAQGAMGPP